MNKPPLKAAVLISGTGSNLKALIDAVGRGQLNLDIVHVVSNRPEAPGLAHAAAAAIAASVIDHVDYPQRQAHDAAVAAVLKQAGAELIILAGYMRILGEEFAHQFAGRMINLHPSLLPLYKGLDTYSRALKAGDTETGASIHFVTAGLDSGPVISQIRMPIKENDDVASLKSRLGPLEHELLAATVGLFCERKIRCVDNTVLFEGREIEQPLQLKPGGSF